MNWRLTCMVSKSRRFGPVRSPRVELATSNDHPIQVRVPFLLITTIFNEFNQVLLMHVDSELVISLGWN